MKNRHLNAQRHQQSYIFWRSLLRNQTFLQNGTRQVDRCVDRREKRAWREGLGACSVLRTSQSDRRDGRGQSEFFREKLGFERFGIRISSPSADREWLKSFNNPSEDSKRGMGQAFIPEENKYLSGWRDVFAKSFHFAWKLNPRRFLTFDIAPLRRRCEDGRHGDRDGSLRSALQLLHRVDG